MRVIGIVAAALVWCAGCAATAAKEPAQARPQVMVLGTFHFDVPGLDQINVGVEGGVLGERRQAEIEAVVAGLAAFRPTKIAVERLPEREAALNETYTAYLNGTHVLEADEIQQIGMRLAKRLGHARLYGVDFRQDMDIEGAFAAGGAAGQDALLADLQGALQNIEATISEAQGPDKTIGQMLRFHNGPWGHAGNALYLKLAVLGSHDNPAGAQTVGDWYARNLKIYANIARLAESPAERILVIYGSGHLALLTEYFDQNPDFDLVSAYDYLPE